MLLYKNITLLWYFVTNYFYLLEMYFNIKQAINVFSLIKRFIRIGWLVNK